MANSHIQILMNQNTDIALGVARIRIDQTSVADQKPIIICAKSPKIITEQVPLVLPLVRSEGVCVVMPIG